MGFYILLGAFCWDCRIVYVLYDYFMFVSLCLKSSLVSEFVELCDDHMSNTLTPRPVGLGCRKIKRSMEEICLSSMDRGLSLDTNLRGDCQTQSGTLRGSLWSCSGREDLLEWKEKRELGLCYDYSRFLVTCLHNFNRIIPIRIAPTNLLTNHWSWTHWSWTQS